MPHRIQYFSALVGILLLAVIFQLIRKNRLLEQYSLLWIASAILLLVFSIWRDLLEKLADSVGIFYAPSALFLIAIFCGMVIAMHFSVVISQLKKQNHTLAQELALLKREVQVMKGVEHPLSEGVRSNAPKNKQRNSKNARS